MKYILTVSGIVCVLFSSFSQVQDVKELDEKYLNWHNEDYASSSIVGTSVEKAYVEFLNSDSPRKTIIVAVIDSGVDIYHEDLEGKIWVNEDEIPDNNLDDDDNGYIDDVYGWNFIGNESGENVNYETLEYTRVLRTEEVGSPLYFKAKSLYDKEISKRKEEKKNLEGFEKVYYKAKDIIQISTKVEVTKLEDLSKVQSSNERVLSAKRFLKERYEMGFTEEVLEDLKTQNEEFLSYHLSLDFNPRSIVGDDPFEISDTKYGNPDVVGPRANHGTSVAGVIAANRNNDIGIQGIATDVKIMAIRSTPNGDERDKDVALAIKYAVDNGADVINMSFGKDLSPQKEFVDDAVRYAEEKGVLLIHSSGNSGKNIDTEESYPSGVFLDGQEAANWLCVGASDYELNEEVIAVFSNYGAKQVDIFAPGVNIVSLDTANSYSMNDGTSLSGPIVSGVAAIVLSVYPDLTPEEIIDILMNSAFTFKKPKKVLAPLSGSGKRKKTKFGELSRSGIVNAYQALVEAEKQTR
ncbi:MAG: S8 family serine peptidase [Bacteroidota bacterium]